MIQYCLERMTEKVRYTISALARKTGLSVHTLRFYEKAGIIRHVERKPSGRRIYGEDSVACLIGALCLKQARLKLSEIKEFFDQTLKGKESLPYRLKMLMTARLNLQEMRAHLSKSLELVDFFISGAREALEAVQRGEDPDEAFPLLTRAGISAIPLMMSPEGKLSPYLPNMFQDQEKGDSEQ